MQGLHFNRIAEFSPGKDRHLPNEAHDALARDGVVCIRQAIPHDWLTVIESGIEIALNGASADVDIVKRARDSGSFSVSSGAWRKVGPFRRYIFESPIVDIAWSLLDSNQLVLFYDFLLIKEPLSNNAATPWHQDHSYYPVEGFKAINCWTALDDIPLESALRFVKGSHLCRTLYRAVDFDDPGQAYRHARPELPLPPEIDQDANVLSTELAAGDMLVWKSYTLHGAPGNRLNHRRAAFSVNWLGDDIAYNDRPALATYREPSLVVGHSMICDKFPLVRECVRKK